MKQYFYFVVWEGKGKAGEPKKGITELRRNSEIAHMDDIVEIEEEINELENLQESLILNFHLLRTENLEEEPQTTT